MRKMLQGIVYNAWVELTAYPTLLRQYEGTMEGGKVDTSADVFHGKLL
jgi:hypothetical protein